MPPVQLRVLILAANPTDLDELTLAEEERVIKEALRQAGPGRVRIDVIWDPSADMLARQLTARTPNIVHFAGHGNERGEPMLRDPTTSLARAVPGPEMTTLLRNSGEGLRCIVLNACFSTRLAQELSLALPVVVVGMRHEVEDRTARMFTRHLYDAIAHGLSVDQALDGAAAAVRASGLPGGDLPQQNSHPHVDPQTLVLLSRGDDQPKHTDAPQALAEALKSLVDLLIRMFPAEEFQRLLRYNSDTAGILMTVATSTAPATFFAAVVDALDHKGLIDAGFFARLVGERPRREHEIRAVQAKFAKVP